MKPAAAPEDPARGAADRLAEYILAARYTRYRPDLGHREGFPEAVARVRAMHEAFFARRLAARLPAALPPAVAALAGPRADLLATLCGGRSLGELITAAFAEVADRRVLPSLRSLQFGGDPILRNHARLFNCAFSNVDRPGFFRGYFFLLLSGCGVGFSVQRHHIARLPPLPPRRLRAVRRHRVVDSVEGWANALDALITGAFAGERAVFSWPAGPRSAPLRRALRRVAAVLAGAAGRSLRPVEVYDLNLHVAGAALAGGGRRSATICLFSPDDPEMIAAKSGGWRVEHPERALANNSAVLGRGPGGENRFRRLALAQRRWGEPGVYFSDHPDAGCNPCGEAGFLPVIAGPFAPAERARLRAAGLPAAEIRGARLSGFQLCNLTTINGARAGTADEFHRACVAATVIGTLQAAYTDIPYLGPVTRFLNERDALLGVSVCGFLEHPGVLLDPAVLRQGAYLCRAANRLVAPLVGVRPAARVTTCKPEGSASLLLGTAAGIHPHPARRYFRRVQARRADPVYARFRAVNPGMTARSVWAPATDDVITFPVEAPAGAPVGSDFGALVFLRLVLQVQRHWVRPGGDPVARAPEVRHGVSHTCTVRPGEAGAVTRFVWAHRAGFTGVAFLPAGGERRYPQAPWQAVVTRADQRRWKALRPRWVDYRSVRGPAAAVAPGAVLPCGGFACGGGAENVRALIQVKAVPAGPR